MSGGSSGSKSGGSRSGNSFASSSSSSMRSRTPERTPSLIHDLEEPPNRICWCYYVTLAGLWSRTIADLEETTGVKASVKKTLPEVAAFYQHAGYSNNGAYEMFDTRDQLKKHLKQLFEHGWEHAEPNHKKDFRMKLAAGYEYSMKEYGHVVVIKVWAENGELMYHVVDYTFDGDKRTAKERTLPQDNQVNYFICFSPIYYFESTAWRN